MVLYGYCTKEYKLFKVTSGIPTKHHENGVSKFVLLKLKLDMKNIFMLFYLYTYVIALSPEIIER